MGPEGFFTTFEIVESEGYPNPQTIFGLHYPLNSQYLGCYVSDKVPITLVVLCTAELTA